MALPTQQLYPMYPWKSLAPKTDSAGDDLNRYMQQVQQYAMQKIASQIDQSFIQALEGWEAPKQKVNKLLLLL